MGSYTIAYEKLKHDYELAAINFETLNHFSPIKKVRVLSSLHGIPSVTYTQMHGEALDGFSIDKIIRVNDETCSTDDDVILHDKPHHVAERFHNVGLTRLRCGLMTCVALEEAMKLLHINKIHRVGFIGNGKTNLQNAACIHDLFGVSDFIIRGSLRNRSKNLKDFQNITTTVVADETEDCSLLNTCDAIISCTSTCDPADQLSTTVLSTPKIFIALDTGYLLDESFRRDCEAFSDDVPQLNAYYHEEFIFDHKHYPLKQLVKDTEIEKPRICVYMFGISFADAEVAEMLYRHEVETPEHACISANSLPN